MPIPRFTNERCLILSDGGLESAVVAAIAAEQSSRTDTEQAVVLASWWGSGTDLDLVLPSIDRAVSHQAEMYGLSLIPDQTGYPPEQSDELMQSTAGSMQTQLLLQSAAIAARAGIRKVIWPIRIGSAQQDFDPTDIELLARTIDRTVLAGRIASLDSSEAEEEVEISIETPLIDFSNAQLADLAGDLTVSLEACWWYHDRQVLPRAHAEFEYWTKLPVLQSALQGRTVEIKSAQPSDLLS
jgi:7-cyano-7-deazaguanine synthase in queuosine biosynthesis